MLGVMKNWGAWLGMLGIICSLVTNPNDIFAWALIPLMAAAFLETMSQR
jgi:hypothetical protein